MMISLFDTVFLAALGLILLYTYLTWNFNYWKKKGIDSDENVSVLFGSMKDAVLGTSAFGEVFTKLYEMYPGEKVVGWFKFREPALFVKDPALVHRILVSDFSSFRNNSFSIDPEVDPILGNNIFVLKDEEWKKRRALITPAFTVGKIKAIYPTMIEVSKEMVKYLKDHPEEMHVKHLMSRYTGEVVARCAFGIEGNSFKHSKPEMHELGKLMFEPSTTVNLKFLAFFFMPKITKMMKLKMIPDKTLKFFDGILRDVIIHRQQNNIERNDLVQYLIEVKKKTIDVANGELQSDLLDRVYNDHDILSGCITFFLDGYETSSVVLNNILYQLALHKDVQEKLREEVDSTLSEGELTFDKIAEMKYLNSVFLETNRILPVVHNFQKMCTERYEMDVGKDKPLVVEEGTVVILALSSLHRDPSYWEHPEEFRPERFSNKEEATTKTKGIFFPFGDGPRICPGMRIATAMVKLGIVQILAEMEVVATSRTPKTIVQDPKSFLIAHKGGIYLKFVERSR